MIEVVVDEEIEQPLSQALIEQAVKTSSLMAAQIESPIACVRFASNQAVQELNAQWRDQDKVTDVLSFPMQEGEALDVQESLGDMVLAIPFVKQEAVRLDVSFAHHCMHLIVHSTLHLLGYDHMDDKDAEEMQKLENDIMQQLGLHIPYPEWLDEVGL